MSLVAINTIVQIDMKSRRANVYEGDHKLYEFCSNENCVVIFDDKSVFGLTIFELWADKARTLEVITPGVKTTWHAVPMKDYKEKVTEKFPRTQNCPQEPPVGG